MAKSGKPRYLDGEALKRERASAGLEQAELAALVGVNQGQVSDWERNYNGCRLAMLHKLAEVLGISPRQIMRDPSAVASTAEGGSDDGEEAEAA